MVRSMRFTMALLCVSLVTSCRSAVATPTAETSLPNPASVYCEEHGGKLELREDASEAVGGVCVFPDGSACEEWAYFRGECQPGGMEPTAAPTDTPVTAEPTATAVAETEDGWRIYRNEELGYQFEYPADARIVSNDNPLGGISIIGPEENGENWPFISISHPSDREEFLPPQGADLLQWLTDHSLLGAERQPDAEIAGATAVHLRYARSPQTYAFDTYYWAKNGQLFQVIIGHTGDKEDWALYERFLGSFSFE
ncbi:MAG: putative hemolysin [Anaerolineae bacterium]